MLKVEEYSSFGVEVFVERVAFQGEAQCACIDKFLAMGIGALMIQPVNEPIMVEKLRNLSQQGIPVVTINTNLECFEPLCYVGNDFFTCGKIAANLFDQYTNGICNIGIVTGFQKAQSHADRIAGFREYIKDREAMKEISLVENHDDEVESFSVTKTLLEKHPEINALFLVAGGIYGAGKALKTFPFYKRIKVVSFDESPSTKELVMDGTILATICQQPIRQGILSLETLFNYLIDHKKPPGNKLYTDIQIKLRTNINVHLGYQ
jgi:LacI family transcriptional regulator